MRKQGHSYRELAEYFECSTTTITKRLTQAGMTKPRLTKGLVKDLPEQTLQERLRQIRRRRTAFANLVWDVRVELANRNGKLRNLGKYQ